MRALVLALLARGVASQRTVASLNLGWKFELDGTGPNQNCSDIPSTFPITLDNTQCLGLDQALSAVDLLSCQEACCGSAECEVYQWCPTGAGCNSPQQCWIGALPSGGCQAATGWQSRGRNAPPPPTPGGPCTDPRCEPGTDDSSWRVVNVPHDFVVEGNFSAQADQSHGFLPYGVGWYRLHFMPPASLAAAVTAYIDFQGIQTASTIWLNGAFLSDWAYGYTNNRVYVNASTVMYGQENVLAIRVDATKPDGWWYDGGGIYRSIVFTAVLSPGPVIAPWGVYAPSNVTGPISWDASGVPTADSILTPSVEVWNNASSPASAAFTVALTVVDASGAVVATATGSGSVAGAGGVTIWTPSSPLAMPGATLWHLVTLPAKPALYTLVTVLTVGGTAVDATNVTFGVRSTAWDPNTGFWLNGVATKILGNANHQDFPAVGVAVPDHLQWYRVSKQKEYGSNGWRTAHNPPTPALLDACDAIGMVVWDENHRNGQLDQTPLLVKRDRNHPSVVIWSICNEVLCNTNNGDWVTNALAMKTLMHELDPRSGRPVSANQNGWLGPKTPLDVQGIDYSTTNYDSVHANAPLIPAISSETSSAVSDRGEYANNATAGHVCGYDNQYPGWGESAEQAWGGIGEGNKQGILTRPFIAGGWTWTGWDYRGEPTPYGFPDKNSHFGIMDLCGFSKDRTWWYKAWFTTVNAVGPVAPVLHAFPHWNWAAGDLVDIWSFSNAASVELFVNDVSLGKQAMPQYSHVQWVKVPFVPGGYQTVSYDANGMVLQTLWRNTTGAPAALRITIRDAFGAKLYAGCNDYGLIMVEVLDAAGLLVPFADDVITLSIGGTPSSYIEGSGNGDPAGSYNNKLPTHPAFHGLILGVIAGGNDVGTITVTANAPGLTPASVTLPVMARDASVPDAWCSPLPSWTS